MIEDGPHPFPSEAWMQAYARTVAAHPRAAEMARSLAGRYRFTITPGGGFQGTESYDLVVDPAPTFTAEPAGDAPTTLTVTAAYDRWEALIEGRLDVVMAFLMRRIKVDGDLGSVRSRLGDAKPLLQCLQQVPTELRA